MPAPGGDIGEVTSSAAPERPAPCHRRHPWGQRGGTRGRSGAGGLPRPLRCRVKPRWRWGHRPWRGSEPWRCGTEGCGGVGLDDLSGLFQPSQLYDVCPMLGFRAGFGAGGGDASALRGMVAQWVCCFFLSVDECISGKGEKEAQKLGESQYLSAASIPNTGAAGKRGKPRPFAARGGGTFASVFCWPCLGMQPPALQGSRCLAAFLLLPKASRPECPHGGTCSSAKGREGGDTFPPQPHP